MILELPDNVTNEDIINLLLEKQDKELSDSVLYKARWGKTKKKYFYTHFSKEWLALPFAREETENEILKLYSGMSESMQKVIKEIMIVTQEDKK